LCKSTEIEQVIDLQFHPLADTFLEESAQFEAETFYPLRLGLCKSCGHVFTLFSIPPEERYQKNDYSYDSSNSAVSIQHFKSLCETVLSDVPIEKNSFIVDIGGNVGTLLNQFKEQGYKNILNVEPSRNISELAVKNGIPTLNGFFNHEVCEYINHSFDEKVDILLSSNVLNHADNMDELIQSAKRILNNNGVFIFEVPYLMDLVEKTAFDTIYHEHVHYYGVKPLAEFMKKHGFNIYKIQKIDYMCGSIRVFASLSKPESSVVHRIIQDENEYGLYDTENYKQFSIRVQGVKTSLNNYLWHIRKQGGKIIGIGAATKGNTLLNYCKLDSDIISFISDASELKKEKFTPGSHIKIISDSEIDESFTHALILPWNISELLKSKLNHLNLTFINPHQDVLV
jgi:SAM-dependent methyltransferase